ncbi:hypothetical protein ACTFIW_004670 [Dictyostelium discoideum]
MNENNIEGLKENEKMNIIFIFVGQGIHWSGMSKELYDNEIIFRNEMDRIDNWLNEKYFRYSIIEKLRNIDDKNSEELSEQCLSHSILFMFQVSLFVLLKHYGIEPNFNLGVSCGEIASSYCSGLIDFENACYILYNRSILLKKTIKLSLNNNENNNNNNNNNIDNCIYNINKFENGLCKINITEKEFNEVYLKKYENIEIAIYCDDNSIMVGGGINDLLKLSNEISNDGIFAKMIPVPTSFHTSSQDIVKNEIMNLKFNYLKNPISLFSSNSNIVPMMSCATCKFFNVLINSQNNEVIVVPENDIIRNPKNNNNNNNKNNNNNNNDNNLILFDNEYLFQNIRAPVKYNQSIKSLLNHIENNNLGEKVVFVEISSTTVLINHILNIIPKNDYFKNESILLLCPLSRGKSDTTTFFDSIEKFNNFKK